MTSGAQRHQCLLLGLGLGPRTRRQDLFIAQPCASHRGDLLDRTAFGTRLNARFLRLRLRFAAGQEAPLRHVPLTRQLVASLGDVDGVGAASAGYALRAVLPGKLNTNARVGKLVLVRGLRLLPKNPIVVVSGRNAERGGLLVDHLHCLAPAAESLDAVTHDEGLLGRRTVMAPC